MSAEVEVAPDDRKDEASPGLALVRDFANTMDAELDTDDLTTPAQLTRFLMSHGLLRRRTPASDDELALARQLRAGLRLTLERNHDGTTDDNPLLDLVGERLPLRVRWRDDGPVLAPVHGGVLGALAEILVAVNTCVADETWPRLKLCPADNCSWAYVDASKNRSKNWCGLGCGNRAKTRAYRARQKAKQPRRG